MVVTRWVILAAVAAALLAAGCGAGSEPPVAAEPPGSTATPTSTSTEPVWPPPDCDQMSSSDIDYAGGVEGAPTPEEAALQHVPAGVSVVRAPEPEPHHPRMWFVLDESGTAIAAVGMFQSSAGGWLVDSEERCDD